MEEAPRWAARNPVLEVASGRTWAATGYLMVALAMDLGMAREKFAKDPEEARALLDEAHDEAKRALTELRNLARGIHPAVLTDRGLDAALSALAGRSTVPVDVSVELPHRPPPTVESAEFLAGVRRVGEGGTALDPEVVAPLLGRRRRGNPLDALSPREREVLSLMAEGRSNAAIAAELVVTDGAVEKHVSNIFAKLGLPATASDHRRVLAVLTYLRG